MNTNHECVFCKIIKKELPAHIISENESCITILDIDPINEGHVLILPKVHTETIEEIPTEIINEVTATIQNTTKAIKKEYMPSGYSIMQNGGEFCEFGHAHFHIFPRYQNDGFGWTYPQGPFECSEKVAEKIKKYL